MRTKITFFSDAHTGGNVVAGAGVDRLGGAVLVLDLHCAGLEVADVPDDDRAGAVGRGLAVVDGDVDLPSNAMIGGVPSVGSHASLLPRSWRASPTV